jgi:hypothetical protein
VPARAGIIVTYTRLAILEHAVPAETDGAKLEKIAAIAKVTVEDAITRHRLANLGEFPATANVTAYTGVGMVVMGGMIMDAVMGHVDSRVKMKIYRLSMGD